jgi:DNA-binding NarL/FixJ family response regulator
MVATNTIDSFPDELLLEIFSYCSVQDLVLSVQHVNKRWKEVSQDPKLWKDLVFRPAKGTNDELIRRVVEQAPSLRYLVLSHEIDAPLLIESLCRGCRDIQKLQFSSSQKLATSVLQKLRGQFPDIECLVLAVHEKYNLTYRLPRTLN